MWGYVFVSNRTEWSTLLRKGNNDWLLSLWNVGLPWGVSSECMWALQSWENWAWVLRPHSHCACGDASPSSSPFPWLSCFSCTKRGYSVILIRKIKWGEKKTGAMGNARPSRLSIELKTMWVIKWSGNRNRKTQTGGFTVTATIWHSFRDKVNELVLLLADSVTTPAVPELRSQGRAHSGRLIESSRCAP